MGENQHFDFLVIGTGPAGIHGAVQAAKLKRRVAIIEKTPGRIGGAWIHTGTLPSKTLREVLDQIRSMQPHVGASWVKRVVDGMSATQLFGRARTVAKLEEDLIRGHLTSNNITLIQGTATLDDANTVRISLHDGRTQLITADNILLATGSRPRRPADVPFDGWRIVDSDEILTLEQVPKRLLIYGAGVIGCEYACIFGALGVQTILADERTHMLQSTDQEIVAELRKAIEALGVDVRLGTKLNNLRTEGPVVKVDLEKEPRDFDLAFFAAGRVSNVEHLGLEKLGIPLNKRRAISVNAHFQTPVPNIYAAGDVIGSPALAATSTEQGRHAALHAFGAIKGHFPEVFPVGIYTIPELSSVGATEDELKSKGIEYVVGRAPFGEIARGYIRGDHFGLLKILVAKDNQRILGIHILGADAANLVHIGLAFMLKDGRAQDLVAMVFNYPTLAEGYRVAAFNALNKIFTDGNFHVAEPTQAPRAA